MKKTNRVIFGHAINEESMPIKEYLEKGGVGVVQGKITECHVFAKETGKKEFHFEITDYTGSVDVEVTGYANPSFEDQILKCGLVIGKYVKVKGFLYKIYNIGYVRKMSCVTGIESVEMNDDSEKKRVELYCHPRAYAINNDVVDVENIIEQAVRWGHKAIAITDCAVVDGYPRAYSEVKKLEKEYRSLDKKFDFKLIYGVEGFLVDDLSDIIMNGEGRLLTDSFVAFEVQPIDTYKRRGKIIRISAFKVDKGSVIEEFDEFVNPQTIVSQETLNKTGIKEECLSTAPTIEDVLKKFIDFCKDEVIVGHDIDFLQEYQAFAGHTLVDTKRLTMSLIEKKLVNYKVRNVANYLKIPVSGYYKSVEYAKAIVEIYKVFVEQLQGLEISSLSQANEYCIERSAYKKHLPVYPATILIANETGRKNLFSLVSDSFGKYYYLKPRILMRDLSKKREGLIIGSGSMKGELFSAVHECWSIPEIDKLATFFDYYEVQPTYSCCEINENEQRDVNRKIVKLGEEYNKPVVATGNIGYTDLYTDTDIECLYNDIKYDNVPVALYLRTTDEMLKEFSYLGEEKAEEVVVTNSNIIADRIDGTDFFEEKRCWPKPQEFGIDLAEECFRRVHEIYGENLPEIVKMRFDEEMDIIKKYNFESIYLLADTVVKANKNLKCAAGYYSVLGSSFVAWLMGITDINPLPAHYYCKCGNYVDFAHEYIRSENICSDMPDRFCPVCNRQLIKDGWNISYENNLIENGVKIPGIDLGYSKADLVQIKESLLKQFGRERIFGSKNNNSIRSIFFVVPENSDINSFTPVESHRKNFSYSTTQIDYHFVEKNLLKIDLLEHNTLTMLQILEQTTGVLSDTIPIADGTVANKMMSLFWSNDSLEIIRENYNGCTIGTLGIPEFGTDIGIDILKKVKPASFSDLLKILGFIRGTSVWEQNGEIFLESGIKFDNLIAFVEDIYQFLADKGMDWEQSMIIAENVRQGRGLTKEWEEQMKKNGIPDWYICSCNKIRWLHRKTSAVTDLKIIWRLLYYKIYFPEEFYQAYMKVYCYMDMQKIKKETYGRGITIKK